MNAASEPSSTRRSAVSADPLTALDAALERTPRYALTTAPLSRALVQAAADEIRRLRAENAALLASQALRSHSQP